MNSVSSPITAPQTADLDAKKGADGKNRHVESTNRETLLSKVHPNEFQISHAEVLAKLPEAVGAGAAYIAVGRALRRIRDEKLYLLEIKDGKSIFPDFGSYLAALSEYHPATLYDILRATEASDCLKARGCPVPTAREALLEWARLSDTPDLMAEICTELSGGKGKLPTAEQIRQRVNKARGIDEDPRPTGSSRLKLARDGLRQIKEALEADDVTRALYLATAILPKLGKDRNSKNEIGNTPLQSVDQSGGEVSTAELAVSEKAQVEVSAAVDATASKSTNTLDEKRKFGPPPHFIRLALIDGPDFIIRFAGTGSATSRRTTTLKTFGFERCPDKSWKLNRQKWGCPDAHDFHAQVISALTAGEK